MAETLTALLSTSGTATAATAGGASLGGGFAGVGAGSAAAGGGAASAGAAAGSGFSFSSILSGSLTALSAFSALQSGFAAKEQADAQANITDAQAKQELLSGRKEALEQKRKLNKIIASNITSGFASGLTGQGSVARASEQAIREGEFQIGVTRDQAKIRSRTKQIQANQQRRSGRAALTSGALTAATRTGSFFTRDVGRG